MKRTYQYNGKDKSVSNKNTPGINLFFIMGISTNEKKLDFVQTILCSKCGQFGRIELYMTYTYFSIFFLPILKWNKQFYVRSSCCNTVYSIDRSLGLRILNGEQIILNEQDLKMMYQGRQETENNSCPNCGYPLNQDFIFCPKCGCKL
jgi:hypothetical protein